MKPSVGTANVNARPANNGGGLPTSSAVAPTSHRNGGGGSVTFFRVAPATTAVLMSQRNLNPVGSAAGGSSGGPTNSVNSVRPQQNGSSGNSTNTNGSQIVLQRLQNNSMVQIRRIITQQPQQFHEVAAELSSSDSSVGFQPRRNGGGGVPIGGKRRRSCNKREFPGDDDESAEVNVSVIDRGAIDDEDEDEDLLIDQDEDDDEGKDGSGSDHRTALEMNGDGVDSEYLKHVIETQILNRHKARIKDWDGTKGHMCQSCHEMFLSENGLETHRNRRIHHILFSCRYCKRDISFFNKCRLIQHLRNHRVTPTVPGLQNCTMIRLLPESDYLHFKYENCTSSSDEDDKGGVSGSGSGGSGPPKRMKPSRFRRVARSSLSGNGLDSPDHSPPPNVTRQIVAPPQQLMASNPFSSPPPSNSTSPALPANNSGGGTIKFAPGTTTNGDHKPQQQQRADQVAVIKSTGNATSVILSSPGNSQSNSSNGPPQIRIRNLSQITAANDDDEENETKEEYSHGEVQSRSSVVKPPSQQQETQSKPAIVANKKYECCKCDQSFSSNLDFFKHLEAQEAVGFSSRSLHRCPTDDIPSWSQCQYVFHTKVFHEQSVPFVCPGCGFEGVDYNALMEHVANDCFYLSLRARYMCAASTQKCSFADKKSVKTEPEIIDHLKKEHSRSVLQCLHCTQGFATENWLLKHLMDAHKINFDESKGEERAALVSKTTRPLTQCLICNILFPNGPTYLQHVYLNFHMHILHAKMLECQSCFDVFETKEELMTHRKQSDKCRRLDPFLMKISISSNEHDRNQPQPARTVEMKPTPIKIIANPAAIITAAISNNPQSLQMKPQLNTPKLGGPPQGSQAVTVISSNGIQMMSSSSQQIRPAPETKPNVTQPPPKNLNANSRNGENSSQGMPNIANKSNSNTGNTRNKPSFFDDLQSCQFCERLVVYGSLRKHEDQCCGLSTVAPGFCLTCRENFGDRKTLALHGKVHVKEGLPICLYCNNRLIRPTHPKSSHPSKEECNFALKKHIYSNHTSKAVEFPFQCPLCDKICNDKRATEFHIKGHQSKVTDSPNASKEPDPAPLSPSSYDIRNMVRLKRKGMDSRKRMTKVIHVYYCPVCKNREFALESGLARHLKLVHQKNPKSLNLSLLRKASTARRFVLKPAAVPTSAPVQKSPGSSTQATTAPHRILLRSLSSSSHELKTRSATNTSPQTVLTRSSVSRTNTSNSTSFTPRFSSGLVLRKRIGVAATVAKKPVAATSSNQKPSPNRPPRASLDHHNPRPISNFLQTRSIPTKSARKTDGTFTCFKCPDFTCKNETAFYDHIKWKHIWSETEIQKLEFGNKAALEERSEFWCPECNTMFVAKPSLVRHLKFAHDYISNVADYMQKIGYDGKKPLKANQCEVCYLQCEDDRELQQHMRTHGMAFLRLRQQRQLTINKS